MLMIENMLSMSDLSIKDMDLLVVCIGLGLFIGFRIGMVIVKVMVYVNNILIIVVNFLEFLVNNINFCDRKICCILDV